MAPGNRVTNPFRAGTAQRIGAMLLFALLLGPFLVGAAPAFAKADLTSLTEAQKQVLDRVSAAFNAIRTMDGKFRQVGPDGQQSTGLFILARPGRILFHYDAPVQLDIRADGRSVAVDDETHKTMTIAFLSQTPLAYLLADKVDLATSSMVKTVNISPDVVTVVMNQDGAFTEGSLTLLFDARTIELKGWIATDAQGYRTNVTLNNVRVGVNVDDSIFTIDMQKYRPATRNGR